MSFIQQQQLKNHTGKLFYELGVNCMKWKQLSFVNFRNIGVKISSQDLIKTSVQQQVQEIYIQYYFTRANQHPDQQLINVINSSKSSLDIAIYSLTEQSIVDAIISAKNRGVTVRVITDRIESMGKNEIKELTLLVNDKIPVKINKHAGLMHLKMTIVDKCIATTGSYNYTENATKENDEVLVIINDSKFAQGFDNEFESMWNNVKEYKNYSLI